MIWTGNAQGLLEYIYECQANRPQEEISLTVNAELATASFLQVRQDMLQRSRGQ